MATDAGRKPKKRRLSQSRRFKILVGAFLVLMVSLLGMGVQTLERLQQARKSAPAVSDKAGAVMAADKNADSRAPEPTSSASPGLPFVVAQFEAHDAASEVMDQAIKERLEAADGGDPAPAKKVPAAQAAPEYGQADEAECRKAVNAYLDALNGASGESAALLQGTVMEHCGRWIDADPK